MKSDLTSQRPIYPLSAYGPGRDAPRQLIEGPVEISPEELRVRYYGCRSAGNEGVAVSIHQHQHDALANSIKARRRECIE
jgi:nucleoporin NUP42